MNFMEKLSEALLKHPPDADWRDCHLEVGTIEDGYEITYGCMYSSPSLDFGKLVKLSKLFGTENIDVDNYSRRGCDSCDWGSDYGHTIQIREITENGDELKKLVGKGDIYERDSR
jgi:hypothetical protein